MSINTNPDAFNWVYGDPFRRNTAPGDEQSFTGPPVTYPIRAAYERWYPEQMPTREQVDELIKALRENTDATRDMFDWLKGHELEDKDA